MSALSAMGRLQIGGASLILPSARSGWLVLLSCVVVADSAVGADCSDPVPAIARERKVRASISVSQTDALIRNVRALGERTAAELKQRWRTLQHVTLSPSRIGDITRAALVLNRHWK